MIIARRHIYHEGQILVRFALLLTVFGIQDCRKSQMHGVTSDWP